MEVSRTESNNVPNASSCLLGTAPGKNAAVESPDVHFFLRKRYLFALLLCIGQIFSMTLQMNLSIAIVDMTSDKNITMKNKTYVQIYTRWAPPNERSRLLLSAIVGTYIGTAVSFPFCGFLAYQYGWEYVFYVTGGISLIWCIIWFLVASNEPTTDTLMTQKERDYFKSVVPPCTKQKKVVYPWRHLFTSKPFYAYVNENFTFFWSQSFLMFCLPIYIKDMFDVNVQNIGIISAIPILGGVVGLAVTAYLADYLRSRGIVSIPSLHRIFITIGQLSCVICFVYIGLWANFVESIIALALARVLMSFAETSYMVLVIDLFYEYSGVAKGFGVAAVGVALLLSPNVMGFMVADHSKTSWKYYFLFSSLFNIWSIIIFNLYGSGDLEEWAAPKTEKDMEQRKLKKQSSDLQ